MAVRVALDGADAEANVKIKVVKLSVDIWIIFFPAARQRRIEAEVICIWVVRRLFVRPSSVKTYFTRDAIYP